MNTILSVLARAASSLIPLTLLSLGLVIVAVVAVIRPTPNRLAMVDRLAGAVRDFGAVIAGTAELGGTSSGYRSKSR